MDPNGNLSTPSIYMIEYDEDDWRSPIYKYLNEEKLNYDKTKMRKIKNQAAHFSITDHGIVRRGGKDCKLSYSLCVSIKEGKMIAESIHQGANRAH